MTQIDFELGSIANHCLELYSELGESYYDGYKPLKMIGATNVVYNFLDDNYEILKEKESITLNELWHDYKVFCDEGNQYKMSKTSFKEELRSYFRDFKAHTHNGSNVYIDFKIEKFIKTDAEEDDILYDEISSGLLVKEILRKKQELFESLELYYKVVFLGQSLDEDLL
jgi:phage/plasmid-associated DNA primase